MRKAFLCLLSLVAYITAAHAGVIVGGTRIIFENDKKETSISVSNPDTLPYLIQAWVDDNEKASAPFIMTPPLFRLDGHQQNILRIIKNDSKFPEDRESLYWINIKSIPSQAKNQSDVLQVAVKTRIKLIYRPHALKGTSPEDMTAKLTWSRTGNHLQVTNPTPYYMNFYEIKIGGSKISDPQWVSPFSQKSYTLKDGASGMVSWKIISDYGAAGKEHSAQL